MHVCAHSVSHSVHFEKVITTKPPNNIIAHEARNKKLVTTDRWTELNEKMAVSQHQNRKVRCCNGLEKSASKEAHEESESRMKVRTIQVRLKSHWSQTEVRLKSDCSYAVSTIYGVNTARTSAYMYWTKFGMKCNQGSTSLDCACAKLVPFHISHVKNATWKTGTRARWSS